MMSQLSTLPVEPLLPLLFPVAVIALYVAIALLNRRWLRHVAERTVEEWAPLFSDRTLREPPPPGRFHKHVMTADVRGVTIRIELERVPRALSRPRRLLLKWRMELVTPAPSDWPRTVELYGRDAIRHILGFRSRISLDKAFDRIVLVRGDAPAALETLCDERLKHRLRSLFEAAPELYCADGEIRMRFDRLMDHQALRARMSEIVDCTQALRFTSRVGPS